MKILVLSHTRCGSTTLCKWISNELNFQLDESPYDNKNFNNVFTKNNIIRKIVTEEYLPTSNDIQKFDKVICLVRENTIDAAISWIIAYENDIWHEKYETSSNWIESNKNYILKRSLIYDWYKTKLNEYDALHITYEDLYIRKKSINNILNYLKIQYPNHLNLLDYNNKYRKDTNVLVKDKILKIL